jgi:hypothetical protein
VAIDSVQNPDIKIGDRVVVRDVFELIAPGDNLFIMEVDNLQVRFTDL